MKYKKGALLHVADTLSRACLANDTMDTELEILTIHLVIPFSQEKTDQLKTATQNDTTLAALRKLIIDGWPPHKHAVATDIKHYWDFREELSVYDDIIFKGEKILVPEVMIPTVLDAIYAGNRGADASK